MVAQRLISLRPQVLHSSDLRRAQETADIISQRLALPIRLCEGLRESKVGTWIGQPTTAYLAHPQALAAQHTGETIVCLSHGTPIVLLARHILGLDVMQPLGRPGGR